MRPKSKMLIWLLIGAGLFVATGAVGMKLREPSHAYRMAEDVDDPEMGLINAIPGGIRAPVISALWYRTQTLKNMGRNYDAVQMGSLLCKLQPHFPTLWALQANDMYANRSAQAKTADERWLWIENGIKLLRDDALPKNKRSLILYKELSWIYFFKIGGDSDEKQYQIKQRMIGQMNTLLGSPPIGDVSQIIAAFRSIADAPLDTNKPAGREILQASMMAELLRDPKVANYVDKLTSLKVYPVVTKTHIDSAGKLYDARKNQIQVDDNFLTTCGVIYDSQGNRVAESLLGAYNRLGLDDNVSLAHWIKPSPKNDDDKAVFDLLNAEGLDPESKADVLAARDKVIAFVRAQLLWNIFHMNPDVMLDLMVKYNLPLDWRHPYAHSFYWAKLGVEIANSQTDMSINALNMIRNIINSLKGLTELGRITYKENINTPLYPNIWLLPDTRFIDPTIKAHMEIMQAQCQIDHKPLWQNVLADGFVVYMTTSIQTLVAENRVTEAQKYYDFVKKDFHRTTGPWKNAEVRDFVIAELTDSFGLADPLAMGQASAALATAYHAMAKGDESTFKTMYAYGRRVFEAWWEQAATRKKEEKEGGFFVFSTSIAMNMIANPESLGFYMSIADRSELYRRLPNSSRLHVYGRVGQRLSDECRATGVDFNKAFPKPDGYENFVKQQTEMMKTMNQRRTSGD